MRKNGPRRLLVLSLLSACHHSVILVDRVDGSLDDASGREPTQAFVGPEFGLYPRQLWPEADAIPSYQPSLSVQSDGTFVVAYQTASLSRAVRIGPGDQESVPQVLAPISRLSFRPVTVPRQPLVYWQDGPLVPNTLRDVIETKVHPRHSIRTEDGAIWDHVGPFRASTADRFSLIHGSNFVRAISTLRPGLGGASAALTTALRVFDVACFEARCVRAAMESNNLTVRPVVVDERREENGQPLSVRGIVVGAPSTLSAANCSDIRVALKSDHEGAALCVTDTMAQLIAFDITSQSFATVVELPLQRRRTPPTVDLVWDPEILSYAVAISQGQYDFSTLDRTATSVVHWVDASSGATTPSTLATPFVDLEWAGRPLAAMTTSSGFDVRNLRSGTTEVSFRDHFGTAVAQPAASERGVLVLTRPVNGSRAHLLSISLADDYQPSIERVRSDAGYQTMIGVRRERAFLANRDSPTIYAVSAGAEVARHRFEPRSSANSNPWRDFQTTLTDHRLWVFRSAEVGAAIEVTLLNHELDQMAAVTFPATGAFQPYQVSDTRCRIARREGQAVYYQEIQVLPGDTGAVRLEVGTPVEVPLTSCLDLMAPSMARVCTDQAIEDPSGRLTSGAPFECAQRDGSYCVPRGLVTAPWGRYTLAAEPHDGADPVLLLRLLENETGTERYRLETPSQGVTDVALVHIRDGLFLLSYLKIDPVLGVIRPFARIVGFPIRDSES